MDTKKIVQDLLKTPLPDVGENEPHFQVLAPDMVHQADLLFLPNDQGYKYLLVVVDANSRMTDGRPLKNKTNQTVKEAFIEIYEGKDHYLKLPRRLEVDSGTEFKGVVAKWFKDKKVFIRVGDAGRSKQQAIVERKNQDIGKHLFALMIEKQLENNKLNSEWVDNYRNVINKINKYARNRTYKTEAPTCQDKSCELLEIGQKVRIQLNEPMETTGEKLSGRFRKHDIRWTVPIYVIAEVLIKPNSPPLYQVKGTVGKNKIYPTAYTRNQLQVVN
jgi:hypothetical protein